MAHKVKPIRWEKRRVRDILPGEIFTINGDNFVMIEPVCRDDKSIASVVLVLSNSIPNLWNIKATMNNSEFVNVRVPVKAGNKN